MCFPTSLCQAENGDVFVYDLLQNSVIPVASSRLPPTGLDQANSAATGTVPVDGRDRGARGTSRAAYSVSCNPRQRDLVATGDSNGQVLIWRLSWRLANKRPGEEEGLERLFKGSVGEVSPYLRHHDHVSGGANNARSCAGGQLRGREGFLEKIIMSLGGWVVVLTAQIRSQNLPRQISQYRL